MEPDGFGPDFHKVFRHPKMAPHLHLCIQSGSDSILKKMRRMYTTRSFMDIVETFRKEMPDFNFTTDVIVGFPGESEDDFAETARVVKEAQFSHIHTFRYSRRKGTRADRLEEQIEERIKAERSEIIRQISEENRLDYMSSMVGKTERILIEKVNSKGMAQGYGEHYLPIQFSTPLRTKNIFQDVVLEKVNPADPPLIIARI
jgi:threonylcarbamoyladenosine tRNA methylthiotransferase MtaB